MELFTVQRYTDDKLGENSNKAEDEILQKLLQKVEKRKRKHKAAKVEPETVQPQITEKKSKLIQDDNTNHEELVRNEFASSTVSSTKDIQVNNDVDPTHVEESEHLKILGEDVDFSKRQKVDMVLPPWLAHPTVISTSISKNINDTSATSDAVAELSYLSPHIRQSLKEMNITNTFPVQSAVIPWLLEAHAKPWPFRPRDICVSSPTGSGKTLAFAVPIVQLLANRARRKIRALVVLPVTELALQVYKVFKKLCDKTDLTVSLLSKQVAFSTEQEQLVELYKGEYHSKVDIIITTPGRLVDHIHGTKGFCLKSLRFLVIDEADRIMDAVFQNWLYHLDNHVRETSDQLLSGRVAPLCYNELEQIALTQPQKLLFSATLSQDPEKLQNLRLFQPKLFTSVLTNLEELREKFASNLQEQKGTEVRGEFIGKYTTPAELSEKYCITEGRLKPLTLYSLIKENNWTKFLCFTNSAASSTRLAIVLEKLCGTELIISDLSAAINASERSKILNKFSKNKINGLVCSDALARGIDIPDVDIVISYDPPRHIKTYIHRIGRTARAGTPGTAITLLTQKELDIFNKTLIEVGKTLTEEIVVTSNIEEENAKNYQAALEVLRHKLELEKHNKMLMKQRAKDRAVMHKEPAKMTIMEKLQMKATEDIQGKVKEKPLPRRKFTKKDKRNK
ncbi:probable ATP-dependent RNA helicase Dbp73D [Teleopsis dalmanni]|uniref:probable ATP-dependent RNA helicase Dbp73D n=1 Tax=Teleopsis dalmanni TaxID=139649 RepID=UPI0018CD0E42|nr:probable ATP-dependent RNA helicase Dbp73D [Teleopsis dalmanni]